MVLATSAQTEQLQILLQRHAYVVSSRILNVLDCLPETLGSQQVADLLALVSNLHLLPKHLQICKWLSVVVKTPASTACGCPKHVSRPHLLAQC